MADTIATAQIDVELNEQKLDRQLNKFKNSLDRSIGSATSKIEQSTQRFAQRINVDMMRAAESRVQRFSEFFGAAGQGIGLAGVNTALLSGIGGNIGRIANLIKVIGMLGLAAQSITAAGSMQNMMQGSNFIKALTQKRSFGFSQYPRYQYKNVYDLILGHQSNFVPGRRALDKIPNLTTSYKSREQLLKKMESIFGQYQIGDPTGGDPTGGAVIPQMFGFSRFGKAAGKGVLYGAGIGAIVLLLATTLNGIINTFKVFKDDLKPIGDGFKALGHTIKRQLWEKPTLAVSGILSGTITALSGQGFGRGFTAAHEMYYMSQAAQINENVQRRMEYFGVNPMLSRKGNQNAINNMRLFYTMTRAMDEYGYSMSLNGQNMGVSQLGSVYKSLGNMMSFFDMLIKSGNLKGTALSDVQNKMLGANSMRQGIAGMLFGIIDQDKAYTEQIKALNGRRSELLNTAMPYSVLTSGMVSPDALRSGFLNSVINYNTTIIEQQKEQIERQKESNEILKQIREIEKNREEMEKRRNPDNDYMESIFRQASEAVG